MTTRWSFLVIGDLGIWPGYMSKLEFKFKSVPGFQKGNIEKNKEPI
jgi:hypothetical protein